MQRPLVSSTLLVLLVLLLVLIPLPATQCQILLLQAYDIPAFHFDLHLCRTNRPPHTAVRGPGEIQAAMLAEHLLEHVAARLGADPAAIRERNFLRVPGARFSTLNPKPQTLNNFLNPLPGLPSAQTCLAAPWPAVSWT